MNSFFSIFFSYLKLICVAIPIIFCIAFGSWFVAFNFGGISAIIFLISLMFICLVLMSYNESMEVKSE